MSEPFLAEIKIFGFNFAPRGWAFCDGQILPINQNQSLFSLLGTNYGGDGRTSFGLPELRGRVPIHVGMAPSGTNHPLADRSGEEAHTLSGSETPAHSHSVGASNQVPNAENLGGGVWASVAGGYTDATPDATMNTANVSQVGSQSHQNMQPYLVLNFCIALQGLFPSRN